MLYVLRLLRIPASLDFQHWTSFCLSSFTSAHGSICGFALFKLLLTARDVYEGRRSICVFVDVNICRWCIGKKQNKNSSSNPNHGELGNEPTFFFIGAA